MMKRKAANKHGTIVSEVLSLSAHIDYSKAYLVVESNGYLADLFITNETLSKRKLVY
jgi:hypothetical protein